MQTQKSLLATIVLWTLFSSVAVAQVFNRVPGSHPVEKPPTSAARLLFNGAISDFNLAFASSREAVFDLHIENPVNIRLDICDAGEDGPTFNDEIANHIGGWKVSGPSGGAYTPGGACTRQT